MTVKDFQFINTLNTGDTMFIYKVSDYFHLPTDVDIETMNEIITNLIKYTITNDIKTDKIIINKNQGVKNKKTLRPFHFSNRYLVVI